MALTKEIFPVSRANELDIHQKEQAWLIESMWAYAAVGIIGGPPKCCKSWLGLDMALSVASGTPCLGQFPIQRPGPALIFLAEDALPAVRETRTVDVEVLWARPVGADELPVMDKLFVRRQKEMKGVLGLGLRPPWGRDAAIEMADGSRLAAAWSRQGSGILGPAPRPGGAVRITVEAAASRSDGEDHQILECSHRRRSSASSQT